MEQLNKFQEWPTMQPLLYTRFEAENIRETLAFLQKGKHIGKMVLAMPNSTENT